jgi:hypothetical protein
MDRKEELKTRIIAALDLAKELSTDFSVEGDRRFREALKHAKESKWELCFLEASDAAAAPSDSVATEFNWFADGIFHNLIIGNVKESKDE